MSSMFTDIDSSGHKLRSDAAQSFSAFEKAAAMDGFHFVIDTAFRSYDQQKALYDAYTKKLDQWQFNGADPAHKPSPVAKPGTSEHEEGIAVDINTLAQPGTRKWIAQNCAAYGWYMTAHDEPWHIAYYPLGPPQHLLDRHLQNVKLILGA